LSSVLSSVLSRVLNSLVANGNLAGPAQFDVRGLSPVGSVKSNNTLLNLKSCDASRDVI
jgi:hypothetical protein